MTLKEFVKDFIQPNSLVRLLYKEGEGFTPVFGKWEDVGMEWEILRKQGIYRHFIDNKVIGLKDILVKSSNYPEAINIIIERGYNIKDNIVYVHEGY